MFILFALVWWSVIVGVFNGILRNKGCTYGGTPLYSSLFYILSTALTLFAFAPVSLYWGFFNTNYTYILVALAIGITSLDWYISMRYAKKDQTWVRNSTFVKYTDIVFQQLMIFIIFVSITKIVENTGEQISFFVLIFTMLHVPVFFVMPRTIAWTFFLASIGGAFIFATLFALIPDVAPYITLAIHTLFYSVLRTFNHNSDVWAHHIGND